MKYNSESAICQVGAAVCETQGVEGANLPVSGWVLAFVPHMQYNAMDRWGEERIAGSAIVPGA